MARSCIDKIGSRRADLNNRFMDFIYQLWNPIIRFIGDSFNDDSLSLIYQYHQRSVGTQSFSTHFPSRDPLHGTNNGMFQDISQHWKLKMISLLIWEVHWTEQGKELMIVQAFNIPHSSQAILSTSFNPFHQRSRSGSKYRQMQAVGIASFVGMAQFCNFGWDPVI